MTPARPSGVEEPAAPAPAFGARANDSARRRFAPRYLLNTIRNIPRIVGSADARELTGAFSGAPTVVVAAGPSLDRALGWLRALPPHVLLIAVDTAARPLLEAGIEPHLVVAVDPSDLNARHLRHLPDTGRTWLVTEGSLDPTAFEWFTGRTFTFAVSDHEPWPWLQSAGIGRGRLRAWGSVLTSALDLALKAGCSPIAFAGADLAYSGGRPYCRGTVYEHDWARRVASGDSLESIWLQTAAAKARRLSEDVHGQPVPTSSALLAFRDWIVQQSTAFPQVRFLNATGDGILRGGRMELCTPDNVVAALGGHATSQPGSSLQTVLRDAWHRGRSDTADTPARLRAALTRIARPPWDSEPRAAWQRFAGPDLSGEALTRAINDAIAGLAQPHASQAAGPTVLAGGAPERVQVIRNAILAPPNGRDPRHVECSSAVADATADTEPGEEPRAWHRLAAVLRTRERLTLPDVGSPSTTSVLAPATRAHAWTPAATPVILDYEAALAELIPGERLRTAGALAGLRVKTSAPAPPPSPTGRSADTPANGDVSCDVVPRLALVADGLAVVAATAPGRRGTVPQHTGDLAPDVAAVLLRAYVAALDAGTRETRAADTPRGASPLVAISIAGRPSVHPSAIDAPDVALALTGALTPVPTDADAIVGPVSPLPALAVAVPDDRGADVTISLSMHVPGAVSAMPGHCGPSWLHAARSLPAREIVRPVRVNSPETPCMIGCAWDDQRAIFTVVNGTQGIRVYEDGTCVPDTPWPCTISGQVRWGVSGAIAWHSGDQRVAWRMDPDGPVQTAPMPIAGARAYPQPDGSMWWTSVRGGLWSWTPGQEWRCLVDTPPLMGLQQRDGGVRLEPRGHNLSFAVRELLTEAFEWTPGTNSVAVVPLGPEGPCWATTRSGDWTALAYPQADAILLRHADGTEHVLTCHYPLNVAWAGASLVVSTGDAALWSFRGLRRHLTRRAHDTESVEP